MNAPFQDPRLAAAVEQAQSVAPRQMLIEGVPCDASDGTVLDVISPIDGAVLTTIPAGTAQDIDRAVVSARQAFADGRWAGLAPKERKRRMIRWAELIESHRADLAVLQARDMGMPVQLAYNGDIGSAVEAIRWYGEAIDKLYDEVAPLPGGETGMIRRVPLGVIGAIVPWNFPSMIAAWKLGPALAIGNSVVLKPAEDASLVLIEFARLALEAGIPAGVLNIVTGLGRDAGAALAAHPDVDCLTFTGSGGVGRTIMEASARSNMKRVSLECGGKSCSIIMADAADPAAAAATTARAMFMNQGQICNAPSRLLVQRSVLAQATEAVRAVAGSLKVGSPLDPDSDLGPLVNAKQHGSVHAAITRAANEGSELVSDGRETAMTEGFYFGPTVASSVSPTSFLGQEEVFGPVLAIIPFDTPEEALAIANGTRYGLGAALWSRDVDVVQWMSDRLHAGTVIVNGIGGTAIEIPFGGFKESGFGRDRSLHAIDKYADFKSIILRTKGLPAPAER